MAAAAARTNLQHLSPERQRAHRLAVRRDKQRRWRERRFEQMRCINCGDRSERARCMRCKREHTARSMWNRWFRELFT
jgi:hypothetical protein